MRYFYQYSEFITSGGGRISGTLADVHLDNAQLDVGYLSFLRLVGVVYFKKHNTGFYTPDPVTHFISFNKAQLNPLEQHKKWLDDIRQKIWDRAEFEKDIMPNNDALYRHWKRTCWVVHMWQQACKQNIVLEPLTDYGWKVEGDALSYDWDSDKNSTDIRQRVQRLLNGCHCRTGCTTARCSCRGNGRDCSEGCECVNCKNIHVHTISDDVLEDLPVPENNLAQEVDEILQWVFGTNTCSSGEEFEDSI